MLKFNKYSSSDDRWTQLGSDIDGEALADRSGYSVSLSSDGTILALIGAIDNNDGVMVTLSMVETTDVRIYQYFNNSWTQIGGDIDGEALS